ncbi:hypothetical protein MBLNU230_g2506t1 [Neophaeotheca triangularis]
MGKLGRIFCISTPMLLTIASFITQIFVEISGWNSSSDTLNGLYFFQIDLSSLDVTAAGDISGSLELATALQLAQDSDLLAARYDIHLWNYCSANTTLANGTAGEIDHCSDREAQFWFNPVQVWGLSTDGAASDAVDAVADATGEDKNVIEQTVADLKDNVGDLADKVLDESTDGALSTYKHVSKWMFIAYQVSLWVTLGTIVAGILAIFSRWGSFITWILSFVSSFFSFAASLTATILFSVLTGALKGLLDPYNVEVHLGSRALAVSWLSTVFSLGATFFWLFSICCCSGRSNPHHKGQRGGLWKAAPKGGSHDAGSGMGSNRGRGLKVGKTGGGEYERVGSPYIGGVEGDRVPLAQYPQPQTGYQPQGGYAPYHQPGNAYEPFRHG